MGEDGQGWLMRQLRYADDAERNLIEIALYIANESGRRDMAFDFTERLRAKCRAFFSALGHRAKSYSEPMRLEMIANAMSRAAGMEGPACEVEFGKL